MLPRTMSASDGVCCSAIQALSAYGTNHLGLHDHLVHGVQHGPLGQSADHLVVHLVSVRVDRRDHEHELLARSDLLGGNGREHRR